MNSQKILLASIFFILASKGIYSETVHMATTDWQPFHGQDLPRYGYIAEIASRAFERKGHTLILSYIPWQRAMLEAKEGKYHGLFGTWKNEDIIDDYYFSQEIMGSGDGHFLVLNDSDLYGIFAEDLIGKTVGFVRGYPVSDELIALIKSGRVAIYEVNDVIQLLKMISLGRIDVVLENYLVAKYIFEREYPDRSFDLRVAGKDYVDGGLYIGWTKEKEGIESLIRDFDDAIRSMRLDGTIEKIEREFGVYRQ